MTEEMTRKIVDAVMKKTGCDIVCGAGDFEDWKTPEMRKDVKYAVEQELSRQGIKNLSDPGFNRNSVVQPFRVAMKNYIDHLTIDGKPITAEEISAYEQLRSDWTTSSNSRGSDILKVLALEKNDCPSCWTNTLGEVTTNPHALEQLRMAAYQKLTHMANISPDRLAKLDDIIYIFDQALLKEVYPDGKVKVFRGFGWHEFQVTTKKPDASPFDFLRAKMKLTPNAISSWTTNPSIARSFGCGYGYSMFIPIEDVMCFWGDGFTTSLIEEEEFVVIGRNYTVTIEKVAHDD